MNKHSIIPDILPVIFQGWACMNVLSSCPLMMKSLEAGVSPPLLYKWLLQVSCWRKSCQICLVDIIKSNLTALLLSFVLTVTVFTESHPSDVSETASQSVPMVSTSTASLSTPGEAVPGDDGDDVFVGEAESEG